MSLFKRSQSKHKRVLVVDIGSSSTAASLVDISASLDGIVHTPTILASFRNSFVIENEVRYEDLVDLIRKSLFASLGNIIDSKIGSPSEIYVVLNAPWYASQTRTISFKKTTPFVISEKMVNELSEKEVKLFKDSHLQEYGGDKPQIVEKTVQGITLNGYVVRNPFGKKTQELSLSLFLSIAPSHMMEMIHETIEKTFHISEVHFSTFAAGAMSTFNEAFISETDYLVLHIGNEVSEVSLVKNSFLSRTLTFPVGSHSMFRAMRDGGGMMNFDEARTKFNLWHSGHSHEVLNATLDPLMDTVSTSWLTQFQSAMIQFSGSLSLPNTVFLVAESQELASWYKEVLSKSDLHQYTMTTDAFNVIVINTEALHELVHYQDGVVRDPIMMTEVKFISRVISL